jgi:four helix bundle protein
MGVRRFEDLVCWQLSQELKREVLAFTAVPPALKDFKFCTQIRDSSASAPSNISEGFGRFLPGEFVTFLRYAVASLKETRNHLIDARDRQYIHDPLYSRLQNLARAAERTTTKLLVQKQEQAREQRGNERNRRGPKKPG